MDGGDFAGGSAGLAKLIDSHGEAIYADLHSEYGLNLVQIIKPGSGYSPRQVVMLIRQLPPDSRTVASLQGGEQFLGWDADRYLMASLVDAVRENTYAFVSANSKKKPKAPDPVTRPSKNGKTGRPKNNQFAAMAAARIDAARKAKGG